jgi:hypothetical protein
MRMTLTVCDKGGIMNRNLGDPVVSSAIPGWSTGLPTPGLGGALVRQGANTTSATEVSPSEGNEVRWDERQEVVAF